MTVAMTDEFTSFDQQAVIKVCGVGGGGGNAVNRMITEGLKGVEFININTDAQALKQSPAPTRIQIGADKTGGLGSGARPDTGRGAAEEDRDRIAEVIGNANMVFLTAGMGGGTGTGASPLIAEAARANGALTVAIVTLPFEFEGPERMKNALEGLAQLEPHVDTLIVIPNDRVAELSHENVSFMEAFRQADEVLHNGVRAISELITIPGLVNLDFADVCTIMEARGRALMGIGRAEGENRAVRAAEEAIVCPLLEQSSINGASSVIVNIKAGNDIGMREVQDAVRTVQDSAAKGANIIFGAVVEDTDTLELQVTVIATGFPNSAELREQLPKAKPKPVVAEQQPMEAPKIEAMPANTVPLEKPGPLAPEPVTSEAEVITSGGDKKDKEGQADLFSEADTEEVKAKGAHKSEDEDFDAPSWKRQGENAPAKSALPDWLQKRRKVEGL